MKIFHTEGYAIYHPELMKKAMEMAKKEKSIITYDLGSFQIVHSFRNIIDEVLEEYVDIVFCNEEELKAFNPNGTIIENLNYLASKCKIAVATLGKRGCMIQSGDSTHKCATIVLDSCEIKDTTGAGDLFIAGFLYGLYSGYTLEQCGQFGCLTGREVCRFQGAEIPLEESEILEKISQLKK
jgi:sugar/nucleoside kinase (ribokinase family)